VGINTTVTWCGIASLLRLCTWFLRSCVSLDVLCMLGRPELPFRGWCFCVLCCDGLHLSEMRGLCFVVPTFVPLAVSVPWLTL
jgi:hypothetical protein